MKNDLTGQIFGRLTVIEEAGKDKARNKLWKCKCSCGGEKITAAVRLKRGSCTSCGCYNNERKAKNGIKHGKSHTPEYEVWHGMKARCTNKANGNYHRYGGRGIKFDPTWDRFENFYKDMGPRPSLEYTLDRIDNNGNYCKNNCRWALPKEQANNKNNNRKITVGTITKNLAEWADIADIKRNTLAQRLDSGKYTNEEAIFGNVKENAETLLTYKGKTQNLTTWAKETGISISTLSGRIRIGWNVEDILTKPIQKANTRVRDTKGKFRI